ncbi:hypothetical protein PROFUN_01803 [Planoprotostelium fungivorum]|uniref:SAM domain-containing protein n=1 Tax=Planoprotostelium fungivorum TaxID=1890364 RepID=A0A2P6NYP5_9EUKA|nr:hypothetical protein PROFUN_01803 [Planoprotostelium fungivorum]
MGPVCGNDMTFRTQLRVPMVAVEPSMWSEERKTIFEPSEEEISLTSGTPLETHSIMRPSAPISAWSSEDVSSYLTYIGFDDVIAISIIANEIDGPTLLSLKESDLLALDIKILGRMKRLWKAIETLQTEASIENESKRPLRRISSYGPSGGHEKWLMRWQNQIEGKMLGEAQLKAERSDTTSSLSWRRGNKEALSKLVCSFIYAMVASFMTCLTMTLVHERVPDRDKYPPLPDLFLDNIQHIPWAFAVVEWIIVGLSAVFILLVFFHKHRLIILRRFFAIAGTVFLLRCVTMYITSLSVPGVHLQCDVKQFDTAEEKLKRTLEIMSGLALSINGVKTCGDYMFSGHTIITTLLNFFIIEYSPRNWKGVEMLGWAANLLGMFFILAAHEHYSIDVCIAFFISSRFFLSYHSLANVMSLSSKYAVPVSRSALHFPFFNYFEEFTDGIVPNEYGLPWPLSFEKHKTA